MVVIADAIDRIRTRVTGVTANDSVRAGIVVNLYVLVRIVTRRKGWSVNNSKSVFGEDLKKDYGEDDYPDKSFF